MADLTNQLKNPNFLASHNFRFLLTRAPGIMFMAQEASIPGITLQVAEQATPFGYSHHNATRMEWQEFDLTFAVDEDFVNYLEIFNWIVGLGFPEDFSKYRELAVKPQASGNGLYSDGTLTVLSSAKNPNIEVKFTNMFPISLSKLDFNTQDDSNTKQNASVTFKYQRFFVEKL